MPVACTYQFGRNEARTVETGSPPREAGQFPAYRSCGIRAAQAVGLVVPVAFSRQGAVLIYLRPDHAHNGAGQPSSGHIFSYGEYASSEYIRVAYDKANARWFLQILDPSSGGAFVVLNDTWSASASTVLYAAWSPSGVVLGVDGGTVATSSRTYNAWSAERETCLIGANTAATDQFLASYGAATVMDGPLTPAQWEVLAGLRSTRPPALGEGGTGVSMLAVWYGADTRVLSAADAVDLNDVRGDRVMLQALRGTGIGPVQHRSVATPLRDGSVYVDTKVVPRRLSAEMVVVSRTDYAAIWDLRRDLVRRLNPRRGRGILTYAPATRLYEIDAIVDQAGAAFDETLGPLALTPRIPFLCDDPAWRDVVVSAAEQESAGEGAAVPFDFPLDFLPGERFTVENEGDLPVYPVVTIEGPVVGPFIRNVTTGRTFALRDSVSVGAGQQVVIDMDARTVLRDDGENLMPGRAADAEMWALEPGENLLEAGFDSAASVPVTFTVQHAPRFVGM